MEKDDEIKGNNNSYDFGARLYDPRVGRWLRPDPLEYSSPSLSPYTFAANVPIVMIDPDGMKEKPYKKGSDKPVQDQPNTETPAYTYDKKTGNKTGYAPTASIAYNCHSYAWHNSQGDKRDYIGNNDANLPRWDNDPTDDIQEQRALQLHNDVRNKVGDRVIYYFDANYNGKWDEGETIHHSAIVESVDKYGNTTTVKGKRGQLGISVNHPAAPGYYEEDDDGNALSRAYMRKGARIQKLGNIRFDSNTARPVKDEEGKTEYLIVQDIDTGKAYGVTRDGETGLYHFYTKPDNEESKSDEKNNSGE